MAAQIHKITTETHFLMEKAQELFPGMKKVVAIAYIENRNEIFQVEKDKNEIENILITETSQMNAIEKLRQNQKNAGWFSSDDLPFSVTPTRSSQKLVFDELSNVVLAIPFLNQKDSKNDLLFLYFNSESGNFGMSISAQKLNTETKTVLANITRQSLLLHLEEFRKTDKNSEEFRQTIQRLASKYQTLKEEKTKLKTGSNERVTQYCKHLLSEISRKTGINAQFSDESLEMIENWNGTIWNLKNIVQNAFDFSWKSRSQLNLPLLVIEDWHLDLNLIESSTDKDEIAKITESKYLKTYALLERLEEAAKRVIGNSQNLTGANVGTAMLQPISAAAITDAIKKNRTKIRSLFDQFPDRWKIIRSEFKPITNMLVVKNELEKNVG